MPQCSESKACWGCSGWNADGCGVDAACSVDSAVMPLAMAVQEGQTLLLAVPHTFSFVAGNCTYKCHRAFKAGVSSSNVVASRRPSHAAGCQVELMDEQSEAVVMLDSEVCPFAKCRICQWQHKALVVLAAVTAVQRTATGVAPGGPRRCGAAGALPGGRSVAGLRASSAARHARHLLLLLRCSRQGQCWAQDVMGQVMSVQIIPALTFKSQACHRTDGLLRLGCRSRLLTL